MKKITDHSFVGLLLDSGCKQWIQHGNNGWKRQCGLLREAHCDFNSYVTLDEAQSKLRSAKKRWGFTPDAGKES